MKKGTKWLIGAALCLMAPVCALAVTEGVVEEAPMVEMESFGTEKAEISYLPDASYYADYGDWNPAWEDSDVWVESRFDGECYYDVEQRPRLTAGEAKRAKALLAAYQAGEIAYTGESVLDKMEDVIVGVYALDPAKFDGEQAFVLLPGPCMTDEQLLAVIAAYDELGLVFNPDALCYRNCARGGGIETNRFLTEEERERYQGLARLIERGLLDSAEADDAAVLLSKLDSRYFCGLTDFTIRPYRATTDEEFVAQLADLGYRDMTGEVDYADVEKKSRAVLNGMLGTALSMELQYVYNEGSYVPDAFDAEGNRSVRGEARSAYGADFTYHTPEGILVYAHTMYDDESDQLIYASAMHDKEDVSVWPDEGRSITHEEILFAVSEAERVSGCSGLTWHAMTDDKTWTNWGECLPVCAQIEEDMWMTVYIGTDDGKAHGYEIRRGTLVEELPEDDLPVNG